MSADARQNTPNGDSAHGHVVRDGAPASLAADLVVAPLAEPSYS